MIDRVLPGITYSEIPLSCVGGPPPRWRPQFHRPTTEFLCGGEGTQKSAVVGDAQKSPFTPPKANAPVRWVEPRLVCEVAFQEWTSDAKMRGNKH
jgi:hypothetical protein